MSDEPQRLAKAGLINKDGMNAVFAPTHAVALSRAAHHATTEEGPRKILVAECFRKCTPDPQNPSMAKKAKLYPAKETERSTPEASDRDS